jgi:hypothetical protein
MSAAYWDGSSRDVLGLAAALRGSLHCDYLLFCLLCSVLVFYYPFHAFTCRGVCWVWASASWGLLFEVKKKGTLRCPFKCC